MDELCAKLLERWRVLGVTPNLGATEADISVFESANQVRLPEDLRVFLRIVNGIPFSGLDGLTRLRPLAEYFRIVDRFPAVHGHVAGPADSERYYCFGDYNIEGSFWGICLGDNSSNPAPVRVFWHDGGGYEVAASFREFLSRYLSEEPDGMC